MEAPLKFNKLHNLPTLQVEASIFLAKSILNQRTNLLEFLYTKKNSRRQNIVISYILKDTTYNKPQHHDASIVSKSMTMH